MTIKEALKKSSQNIDHLDAEVLLCHVLKLQKAQLLTQSDSQVPFFKHLKFNALVQKRKNNTPIAYLTGHKEFYGLEFFVNRHTLVPRPDSELMVELALSKISDSKEHPEHTLLLDVGTGTGCIPISILKHAKKPIQAAAIDISTKALEIAKRNIQKHDVDLTLSQGNLLKQFIEAIPYMNFLTIKQLIITANLPYLTQEEIDSEESIQKEPRLALYADDFGLALYKKLQQQIKELLVLSPVELTLFMEINDHQAEPLEEYSKEQFPKGNITTHRDLSRKKRIVEVSIKQKKNKK